MTLEEYKNHISEEIEKSERQLAVQQGTLDKNDYLQVIRENGISVGLSEEEAKEAAKFAEKTLWGFDILDDYMNGTIPDVTDIRLIDEDTIEVKIKGKRSIIPVSFKELEPYKKFISFITSRNSTSISISSANQVFADVTTSDKFIYRYTLVSDLLNVSKRTTLHVRLTPKKKKTMDTLIEEGMLTREEADRLIQLWQSGESILVFGPNGSGKTTFQNALLDYTPYDKSMAIIGEIPDLFVDKTNHPMTVSRQILPAKTDTVVSYSLRDECRSCLTESIDIMVVSEIKGDEAADFGYAAYTGSQVMSSIHAVSAEDGFERICDLGVQATGINREFFKRQLKNIKVAVFIEDYKMKEILIH